MTHTGHKQAQKRHPSNKNVCSDLQPDTHRLLVFLPTVVVCCHGDAGIAQAGLLGQDHLWHSGHIDDVSAPLAEHQALCPRGKAGPLDAQHGPSHMALDPQAPRHLDQNLRQDWELGTVSIEPVGEEVGAVGFNSYSSYSQNCWMNQTPPAMQFGICWSYHIIVEEYILTINVI